MRVFVSEYIAGGALSGSPLPPSLLREGQAMLAAVLSDFLAIECCQVVTTMDRRLAQSSRLSSSGSLTIIYVDHPLDEQAAFLRGYADADVSLVIAPETGGVLRQRVATIFDLGRTSLNCSPAAIDLCGDKLRLAEHLIQRGMATIPTRAILHDVAPWEIVGGDCVIKPRDGAGSWLTFLVPDRSEATWHRVRNSFVTAGVLDRAIVQPRIPGVPLSVGCLCDSSGRLEIFPIAKQDLTDDFQYQGGSLPVGLERNTISAIEDLVSATCRSIDGLRGYIGIDLLLPEDSPTAPIIVEINPRLTTSYVGYRRLSQINLASRMLGTAVGFEKGRSRETLTWHRNSVRFDAAGECQDSTS